LAILLPFERLSTRSAILNIQSAQTVTL